MTAITLNEAVVLQGSIGFPKSGLWVAQLSTSMDQPMSGEAVVSDGNIEMVGTVLHSGLDGTRIKTVVQGGTGDSSAFVGAKNYNDVSVRKVVEDIGSESGFKVSPSMHPSVANRRLPFYTRTAGTAGEAMITLAWVLDDVWSVDRAGRLLVGYEGDVEAPGDFTVLSSNPQFRSFAVDPESLALRPGTKQQGKTIVAVDYSIGVDLRAAYWTND